MYKKWYYIWMHVLNNIWCIFPSCKNQCVLTANDSKKHACLKLLHLSSLQTTLPISTYLKQNRLRTCHDGQEQKFIPMIFYWAAFNLPPVKVPDGSKVSPARVTVLVLTLGSKVTYNTKGLKKLNDLLSSFSY